MGAFSNTFNESTPQGSDLANTLDTVIQTDKKAIDERIELEHQSFVDGTNDTTSPTAQGRHVPGKVSAVLIDTLSNIQALTGMVTGALAYDTDSSRLLIYNGTDWTTYPVGSVPTAASTLAFYAYLSGDQSGNFSSATKVKLNAESYDYGSKFASYKYTPGEAGLYTFNVAVKITGGYRARPFVYKNGSVALGGNLVYSYRDEADTLACTVSGTLVSDTNDYFELYCAGESNSNIFKSGVTNTYFCGHKIASL